jgi:PAS domain S-box-containing protein
MRLVMRLGLIILVTILVSAVVINILLRFSVLERYRQHDLKIASSRLELLDWKLNQQLEAMDGVLIDWSQWDDAYNFILHPSSGFIKNNMPANFHRDQHVQAVAFLDLVGEPIYLAWFDLELGRFLTEPPKRLAATIAAQVELWSFPDPEAGTSGYMAMDDRILQITARPVVTSSGTGQTVGTVLFARVVDRQVLDRLVAGTNQQVQLAPADLDHVRDDVAVQVVSQEHMVGQITIRDLQGVAIAQLTTKLPRSIYLEGLCSLNQLHVSMAAVGILVLLVLIWQMRQYIGLPLAELLTGVNQLRRGDFEQALPVRGRDELSQLAQAFNEMAHTLDQRYEAIFNHTGAATLILDTSGQILLANQGFWRLVGLAVEQSLPNLFEHVHPDDLDRVRANHHRRRREPDRVPNVYQFRFRRFDGADRLVAVSVGMIPGTDHSVASLVDITEAEQSRQALVRSGRLASLGSLAGGVAHEFNNLIASIQTAAETVQRYGDLTDPSQRMLEVILEATSRASLVASTLESFAGHDAGVMESTELSQLIQHTLLVLERGLRQAQISVQLELAELPPVRLVPTQIRQVIFALLRNASDACHHCEQKHITVATGSTDREQWLAVADTGVGLSEEETKLIFSPFFTGKGVRAATAEQQQLQGLGLGLSVAETIVRQHGGRIEVSSRPGEGARFTVYLPMEGKGYAHPAG